MLGYYDGLDIHTIDKWYDLRPKGLLKRNLQVDLDSPYIDQYTIRAFIPANREELEKAGFTYNIWEKIGNISSVKYENNMKDLRSKYPFVCMSLINVTEEFVEMQDNLQKMQDTLMEKVKKCVYTAGGNLKELHCAIFPSF